MNYPDPTPLIIGFLITSAISLVSIAYFVVKVSIWCFHHVHIGMH